MVCAREEGGRASGQQAPVQPIHVVPPSHEIQQPRPIRHIDAVDNRVGRGKAGQVDSGVGLPVFDPLDVSISFFPPPAPSMIV